MIDAITSPFEQPAATGTLCLILDGSYDPHLLAHLFQGDVLTRPQCIPLFINTPYAELQSAGPCVVVCPAKSPAMVHAKTLLEESDAGCMAWLSNIGTLNSGVEHWRRLLTVRTDQEQQQMMRFYEPRWLEPLLLSLDKIERMQFIGPFTGLAWRNEIGWRYCAQTPHAPATELQPPGWLHLGTERQTLIERGRLKVIATRFANDYQELLPADDTIEYVHGLLVAAQQAGYQEVADQERWLRLALSRGDAFWKNTPDAQLLARSDMPLGEKLTQLESF
jgi:hypothetical protein